MKDYAEVASITPTEPSHQWLVRFNNSRTYVYHPNLSSMEDDDTCHGLKKSILQFISQQTRWPLQYLQFENDNDESSSLSSSFYKSFPFVSVRIKSQLLGGKGGFGTLLKGQSKQAGAKTTTDFGACRDLQGRRLRHVNDEIKLRKWKELEQRRKNNKDLTIEEEMKVMETSSGILNWHLMVPHWASDSFTGKQQSRMQHQWKQQLQSIKHEEDLGKDRKRQEQKMYQQSVDDYVSKSTDISSQISESISDAIQQGIQRKKTKQKIDNATTTTTASNKRKLQEVIGNNDTGTDHVITTTTATAPLALEQQQPQSLCTLSGDVILEEGTTTPPTTTETAQSNNSHTSIQIQSKSDFCTVALMLERMNLSTTSKDDDNGNSQPMNVEGAEVSKEEEITHHNNNDAAILYYEVQLVTGGLAQIGWAAIFETAFQPNNDTGDGVGDDASSYAYDGSRGFTFHNGQEQVYPTLSKQNTPTTTWKSGDVIGCYYDMTRGEISFALNGKDLGIAFTTTLPSSSTIQTQQPRILVPAMSCNQNEILEVHIHSHEMKYFNDNKQNVVAVGRFLAPPSPSSLTSVKDEKALVSGTQKQTSDVSATKPSSTSPLSSTTKTTITKTAPSAAAAAATTTLLLEPLMLDSYSSIEELEKLGMDRLKGASIAIGVKCGGSLQERAKRLFSLKGVDRKDYPMKVRAKNFVL